MFSLLLCRDTIVNANIITLFDFNLWIKSLIKGIKILLQTFHNYIVRQCIYIYSIRPGGHYLLVWYPAPQAFIYNKPPVTPVHRNWIEFKIWLTTRYLMNSNKVVIYPGWVRSLYLKRAWGFYEWDGFHILVAHFNKKFTFTNPKTEFLYGFSST